jgi:hypothetical protein
MHSLCAGHMVKIAFFIFLSVSTRSMMRVIPCTDEGERPCSNTLSLLGKAS